MTPTVIPHSTRRMGSSFTALLQANPTGEQSYPHLSDLGGAAAFAASSEFARVTSSSPLKLNYKDAAGKLNQAAVQQIVQIRDLSDMVLMDFIMSQADRFSGNMHSEKVYLWIENGVLKSDSKKSDPAKAAEQLKQIPAGAVLVNRMIMKDNDAGLISGNSAKTYHLLEKISHMDSKTYDRLLDLQKGAAKTGSRSVVSDRASLYVRRLQHDEEQRRPSRSYSKWPARVTGFFWMRM